MDILFKQLYAVKMYFHPTAHFIWRKVFASCSSLSALSNDISSGLDLVKRILWQKLHKSWLNFKLKFFLVVMISLPPTGTLSSLRASCCHTFGKSERGKLLPLINKNAWWMFFFVLPPSFLLILSLLGIWNGFVRNANDDNVQDEQTPEKRKQCWASAQAMACSFESYLFQKMNNKQNTNYNQFNCNAGNLWRIFQKFESNSFNGFETGWKR